jgi:hypothetical protein
MFTQLEEREVITHGVGETTEFRIKANGKAFKILIDGLYSDKIRAVIRELWSNAYDSHAEADKLDVPFDCQMPTVFNPEFRVRDYGVALSHENVMHLYTTIFESSKEDTNVSVGKLGLGSKSPFAYTDTFTVTSWFDGMKRLYSAYIGSDHIPRISLMHEEETDEPQGLEIAFPVKSHDCPSFQEAAEIVRHGFDVAPNIIGGKLDPIENDLGDVLAFGDNWTLYSKSGTARARQGCVVYPIDSDAIVGLTETEEALLLSNLHIAFPIGQLEITANREGLGYDAPTVANIKRELAKISSEIVATYQAQIDAIHTRWELMIWYADLTRNLPTALRAAVASGTWKNINLTQTLRFNSSKAPGAIVEKYDHSSMRKRRPIDPRRGAFDINPQTDKIYVHYTEDKIPGMFARIFANANRYNHNAVVVRAKKGSMALARALVALGRPEYTYVKALPPVDSARNDGAPRTKISVKVWDGRAWVPTTVTAQDGGIYICKQGQRFRTAFAPEGIEVGEHRVDTVIKRMHTLGALDATTKVYCVPKSLMRVLKGNGWVSLWTVAENTVRAQWNQAQADRHAHLHAGLEGGYFTRRSPIWEAAPDLAEKLPADSPLRIFWETITTLRREMKSIDSQADVLTLANQVGIDLTANPGFLVQGKYLLEYMDIHVECETRYPLLSSHDTPYGASLRSAWADYVMLKDAAVPTQRAAAAVAFAEEQAGIYHDA